MLQEHLSGQEAIGNRLAAYIMTRLSFNFNIPGYQLVEELHRDARIAVYRARSDDQQLGEDSGSVVIKLLLSEYPSDQELLSFRHQYAIMRYLAGTDTNSLNLPGVVFPYSLEKYGRGYALIMEDFGGISLARYIQQQQLALADILNIAIQLVDILHAIGLQGVVHKDIKPTNILIHPVTKQVQLIDFSIAFLLPHETQEIVAPQQLEGTLAYLSPEQTGRMNRGIDYRTDFYALGVTLYELLTGKLPFIAEDPLELIHCHLAQVATPIHLINADIPLVVSQLVAKLMAKNVEDRYQAALGIKYDLELRVVVACYVQPWHEPLRTTIPLLDEGIRMAIESGNLQYIGLNAAMSIANRLFGGIPLAEIIDLIPKTAELVTQSNDENSQQFFEMLKQTIFNLHIPSSQPIEILKGQDRLSLISHWQASNEDLILSNMYGLQTFLAYHFEDIPTALLCADAQLPYEYAVTSSYLITQVWTFDALTRLAAYPSSTKRIQQQLLDRVKKTQHQLGKRARSMPANFQHQYDLVAAEKCRVLGDFTQAIDLYDQAISGAKTNEFIQVEALANELAAKFYLGWGKDKIADIYMQSAYHCYLRWGARAKTAQLEQCYPQLLAPIIHAQQTEFNPLVTLAKITNSVSKDLLDNQGITFDLASVIQSAQALSSTIDLEELIKQLSQIILHNSGAESCILALPNLQDQWQISRSSLVDRELLTTQLPQTLIDSNEYPTNLIYWVKNTQTTIIFDARLPIKIPDLYLLEHQPQSVFCLPIVKQDKVLGVLYLEHLHAPDIFTPNKKTVVTFLCSQAAIALENANLYRESQQAAENIRLKQRGLEILLNDRKTMEIALSASEQRYHQLVSNIPAALYQFELTTDGSPRINYVSERFPELFEVSAVAVLADISVLFDLVIPEDRSSFDTTLHHSVTTGTSWKWEGRVLMPSGQIKWMQGESRPTTTLTGSIVWDGILQDITEAKHDEIVRKKAESALRQSEERYQKLSDNIPGVIYQFRIAPDGGISYPYISSGSWELFQLVPTAVMADANCAIELMHPDDILEFQRLIAESAQNMTPKLWEGRAILKSGEIKWIKSVSRPELQSDGSIIWDGVMLDITERQQAQLNLNLMNEQLELTINELQGATRLKDEFLATMSHELRTPLNAILGMSESLQEEIFGAINACQLNAILTIEQSGQHLLALINDVLDVSKISAGKLELYVTPVNIAELCKSSLILVRQQALAKQIQIDTHLPADLDQVLVDERRLRQVLINLLSNAIKFTAPGGQVVLSVVVTTPGVSHHSAGYSVCFAVSDTGIGIASTDLPKLFQPFIQIDSNLNRKYAGTGLGLVLVKQIVELHGGYVTINSEIDKGSCFSVVLPQADVRPAKPSNKLANSKQHYSHCEIISNASSALPPHTTPLVLLAEDNEINVNTLSSYLTAKGYRIILAQNGQEAISLNQIHHPDLILMDIQMPEMDGIVAIKHIRQHSQPQNIPIIALTALAMDGDREKCLAMGANRYLAKPFKLQELHNTIQECLDMN